MVVGQFEKKKVIESKILSIILRLLMGGGCERMGLGKGIASATWGREF